MTDRQNFLDLILHQMPDESKWILHDNLPGVSQARIYQLLLQLEQDVLRKTLTKRGADSPEYKFFMELKNVLFQAGEQQWLIDRLRKDAAALKTYNDYLTARCAESETEINRWRTIEELCNNGLLENYATRVREVLKKEVQEKP